MMSLSCRWDGGAAPAVRLPLTPAAYISFLALGAADRVYTRRLTGLRPRPEGAQFRGSVRHCAVPAAHQRGEEKTRRTAEAWITRTRKVQLDAGEI